MGLRFRKSVKICKGVRVNFSKSGVGVSVGTKGARYTVGANGRRTATVGIPGTGIYHTSTLNKNSKAKVSQSKPVSNSIEITSSTGEKMTVTPETVKAFQAYLDKLRSFHSECNATRNWESYSTNPSPLNENGVGKNEIEAQNAYDSLKPNFMDKLVKNGFEKRKEKYLLKIEEAKKKDQNDYENWKNEKDLADRVLDGDIDSYYEVLDTFDPFVTLSEYGTDIEFGTDDAKRLEVEFCSLFTEIIPTDKLVFTPSGKISHKKMTKTEFYDYGQDYVCSYAIRIAREVFALLPVEEVLVHVVEKMDGVEVEHTILSVLFKRDVFDKTDFSKNIDASDYVELFDHNMSFVKTKGFKEVDRIK